ncbi:MAG: hypothetical protein LQ351_007173 [Letrouitia transgressa]|nr:MAG: hypothetical protein LQ351_007173 [Letrouitia transgressa]
MFSGLCLAFFVAPFALARPIGSRSSLERSPPAERNTKVVETGSEPGTALMPGVQVPPQRAG